MKLAVVSHKLCWPSPGSPSGYATDGGFPLQMGAISELFAATSVVAPCESERVVDGVSALQGNNLSVVPLAPPKGRGLGRKLRLPLWAIANGRVIWQQVRAADAVHAPIPGDVGTIGMLFALIQRKPLFVRHCGNWFVQRTAAERLWKRSIEYFAGGRNVMLATGGSDVAPSSKNANVSWIFSTSLRAEQLAGRRPRTLDRSRPLHLVIASRQEERKGTDIVIDSLQLIPGAVLDVVGGGSLLDKLKTRADESGVSDRVTFHGKVPQARVLELLDRADVFCYPTSASEGFPKVVLEALACGLPVVTTAVSVLPKLISGGGGVLLDNAAPDTLAAAV